MIAYKLGVVSELGTVPSDPTLPFDEGGLANDARS